MPNLTDVLVGKLALRGELVTEPVLLECMGEQRSAPQATLGQILVRRRLLSSHQLVELLRAAERTQLQCPRCTLRCLSSDLDPQGGLACPRCGSTLSILFEGQVVSDRMVTGHTHRVRRGPAGGGWGPGRGGPQAVGTGAWGAVGPGGGGTAQWPGTGGWPGGVPTRADSTANSSRKLRLPAVKGHFSGTFGPYEIAEELGRGGMGVVYKARQPHLDRFVALKILLAGELASATQIKRFQREAEVAARLKHPGIVQIHDVGVVGEHHYFTMDYIEGEPLSVLIKRRKIGIRRAVEIARDVARALDHAHQRGAIHRDVKPANIIVDRQGNPVLTDFGLARDLDDEQARLTRSGAVVGTPYYMAPEQARGKRDLISGGTDVYALGVVLYEMLTFDLPFRGETQLELTQKILDSEPPRPTSIEPAIDRDVETIVLKALGKEPADRFTTAGAMADDLDRYLRGEPILARRHGAFERVWRQVRKHWLPVGGAAAGLVGVAGITYAVVTTLVHGSPTGDGGVSHVTDTPGPSPPPSPSPSASPSPSPGIDAGAQAARDEAFRLVRQATLTPAGPEYRDLLEQASLALTGALAADADAADLLVARAHLQERLRRLDDAAADYRKAVEVEPDGPRGAEAAYRLGRLLYRRARTQSGASEAIAIWEEARRRALQDGGVWAELLEAALAFVRDEDPRRALSATTRAKAIDATEAEIHAMEALALANLGQVEEAIDASERAVQMDPKDGHTWATLGQLRLAAGSSERGLDALERALEIDPKQELALQLRASYNQSRGRIEEAIDDLRVLLDLHPDMPELLLELASLYEAAQRPDQADRLLERARLQAPEDPRIYLQESNRHVARGEFRRGLEVLRRGIQQVRQPQAREELFRRYEALAQETGEHGALRELARDLLTQRADDPQANLLLAQAHCYEDATEEGLALLAETRVAHPEFRRAWEFEIQAVSRTRPEALPQLMQAYEQRFGNTAEGLAFLARILAVVVQDYERATAVAQAAVRLDPNNDDALTMLGYVSVEQQRRTEGRRFLLQAVQADPRNAEAMSLLGACEYQLRNLQQAELVLKRAYSLNPLHLNTAEGLAHVYLGTKRYEQCLAFCTRFLDLLRAARRPTPIQLVLPMSEALLRTGRAAEAVPLLEEAAAVRPHPDLKVMLAQAYAEAGRRDDARRVVDEVLAASPSHRGAQQLRAVLGE